MKVKGQQIASIFSPLVAQIGREMVAESSFELIPVHAFPNGAPTYDDANRLAYFALRGSQKAFKELDRRVRDRGAQIDARAKTKRKDAGHVARP